MEKLPLCTELFEKGLNLKVSEYLYTSFGAEYTFTFERKGKTLLLKVWDCYHTFEYQPKQIHTIKEPKDIVSFLVGYPRFYAENYYTKQLSHMDNWVEMIKAFKVRTYSVEDKHKK